MGEASFGKYRLIAELGHGGMADVFLAVTAGPVGSGFSKLTVIKRLRQNLADEPEFVEMLVDEARISARLNHPNVVQTNEVGSVDNQYFISMEYLDGQPLHRIQHRAMQKAQKIAADLALGIESPPSNSVSIPPSDDPFPKECQYLVILETLAGLHHAHELADYDGTPLEVVHRDVTPHNIFVTYEGQTKVVDFGIAKAVGRASETRQGVVKGKVRYMAPEQAVGQRVDRRADLFSVGVMLWEAATGRRLWKDMDDLNIVQALVGGTIRSSPREIDPALPEEIDRICQKALAFDVGERYATAEQFRADLEQYLADSGQLVSARRKLGPVVSALFMDKRTEIKAVIEKQLAQLQARSSPPRPSGTMAAVDASTGSSRAISLSSGAVAISAVAPAVESDGPTSITDAATELYTASKKKQRSPTATSRLPVLLAVAALVVVTGVFATTRIRSNAAAAAAAVPTVDAPPTEIRVRITTTPPNAVVSIDGAPVANAGDTKLPRDSRDHSVRVEAPGFEPHAESARFENDVAMSVVLTPTPPATVKTPAPKPPTAAAPQRWWPPPPKSQAASQPVAPAAPPAPAAATTSSPAASSKTPKMTIDTKDDPWAVAKPR